MLSTSFEFRSKISENSKVLFKATLTLADGTVKELVGDDFMMGSMSFSDAVSSGGSFDIGAAIINKLDFTLNNYDRRFDSYDFTGATVVPYVGVELRNGNVEWLMKGHYGVEQPDAYGTTIRITALDNMRKLERPYSDVATAYPATLRTIVTDICSKCGVTLGDAGFANCDFKVAERPDDGSLTCLAALSYAAQASGNWARFDQYGYLRLEWYNTAAFEGEDWLDGGTYSTSGKPYSDGDAADGGNFTDYGSGAAADGGEFGANPFAHVSAYRDASIATDDVVVTGLRVTAQDDGDLEGETSLYGGEGYVIEVPDNPFVQRGKAAEVSERVGKRVVGMRFRPFDASALGNPAVEAGDPVVITDRHQNQYRSYITALTYRVGAYAALSCNAETPSRNRAQSYSAETRALVKLRNAVKREKTAREQAVADLADQLASSSGLFMTVQKQSDGSTIYYMHDKPTLAESKIVWKLAANAFGVSTDGGKTYPYGLDAGGKAVLNRIYAEGINAYYINAGEIRSSNGNVSMDLDTGSVTFKSGVIQSADGKSKWDLTNGAFVAVDAEVSGTVKTTSANGRLETVMDGGEFRFLYDGTLIAYMSTGYSAALGHPNLKLRTIDPDAPTTEDANLLEFSRQGLSYRRTKRRDDYQVGLSDQGALRIDSNMFSIGAENTGGTYAHVRYIQDVMSIACYTSSNPEMQLVFDPLASVQLGGTTYSGHIKLGYESLVKRDCPVTIGVLDVRGAVYSGGYAGFNGYIDGHRVENGIVVS